MLFDSLCLIVKKNREKIDVAISCIGVNKEVRNLPKLQGNRNRATRLNKHDHSIGK